VSNNFQETLLREIGSQLQPLVAAARSDLRRRQIFANIGWDLEAITGLPIDELSDTLTQFVNAYDAVIRLIEIPPESLDELSQALDTVDATIEAIRRLSTIMDGPALVRPPQFEELGRDLLNFLAVDYLRNNHPVAYQLAVLLTMIHVGREPEAPILDSVSGTVVRIPHVRPRLALDRLAELLADPIAVLEAEYLGSTGLTTPADAKTTADKLFPRLGALFDTLGMNPLYSIKPAYEIDFGQAGNELSSGMLTFFLPLGEEIGGSGLGATLALSPAERGNLGLVVAPFGEFVLSETIGRWALDLELRGDIQAFAIGPDGLTLPVAPATPSIRGQLSAIKLPEAGEDAALLVGSTTGTRLEVSRLMITGEASLDDQGQDYGLLAEAGSAALVVSPGDGDGFLQEVLPRNGIRTDFDLALGWSSRNGFYLRGSAGLEATLPVHANLLGVLRMDSVYLALRTLGKDIVATTAASAALKLGPVNAQVDRLGLLAKFTFPQNGGNLGPANVELDFKPPSGVGLAIDAGAITGGGFLSFDPEREQYAGGMHLELEGGITLNAVGLLTTRLPDGSRGFSLLVIVTASGFTPIQLGFGFTLNGVGGLLGINRTVATEVLRAGVRSRTLEPVLYSQDDPTPRAPQIVSTLQTVFPPARDRYVFGPLALIGWGTPTVLTIEVALILELPAPVRLIVLGRLRAVLPTPDAAIVTINMDVFGLIDFDRAELSVDASLYDSRVGPFALTGDMAARASWGLTPDIAMALGGFHPAYKPPPGFPELRRLALALSTGNNPRVRMEAYFALTSNTVQVGARLELYVEAAGFSLEGGLGFDTLIQFSPFRLLAEIYARLALKRGSTTLMGLDIHVHLIGPAPWVLWGEASFKLLFISISIPFRATIGRAEETPEIERDEVWPKLYAELRAPTSWTAQLPPDSGRLVVLRGDTSDGEVLAHPLGSLIVSQRVVPLERTLDLFGAVPPKDFDRFEIVGVGGLELGDDASDYFAPAQFRRMSDAEKLSSPSFERMVSGVHLNPSEAVRVGYVQETPLDYEQSVILDIDQPAPDKLDERYQPDGDAVAALAEHGPAGTAELRDQGRAKFAPEERGPVVAEPEYVVATKDGLEPKDLDGLDGTYTGARERLRGHPDRDELQVVRKEEVVLA
jgi:hypothetical protein